MSKEELKGYIDEILKDRDINILSYLLVDIDLTMEIIKESTDSEFYYLSDYFEDIAYMSNRKEFIDCIRDRFIEMKDNSLDLLHVCDMIKYAEDVFPIDEY